MTTDVQSAFVESMTQTLPVFMETLEKGIIERALQKSNNNKKQAAQLLGLNRTTFVEKCRRFGFPLNIPVTKKKI